MPSSAFVKLIRLALLGQFPSVDNGGYDAVAEMSIDWMKKKEISFQGQTVLDLGGGTGIQARNLAKAGARVVIADLRVFPVSEEAICRIRCDALSLAISHNSIDIIYCSNMLEHIPPPMHDRLYKEMYRVLRPGGWIHFSWGNWLSPFGGHEHSPFHYLGSAGMNLSCHLRSLRGRSVIHYLGVNLFRTYIGDVVRKIKRSHPDLYIVDMVPRYWPWLGFICKVPWVREFLTWNCVILLRKL